MNVLRNHSKFMNLWERQFRLCLELCAKLQVIIASFVSQIKLITACNIFWSIWYKCQRAYTIIKWPSYVVVFRHFWPASSIACDALPGHSLDLEASLFAHTVPNRGKRCQDQILKGWLYSRHQRTNILLAQHMKNDLDYETMSPGH